MSKFTQKWAIIALLEEIPDGTEFYYTDYPLHMTIAGVFELDKSGLWLSENLTRLLINQKEFDIKAGAEDHFGPDKDIQVMKIIESPELLKFYNKIHNWLLSYGAIYNEPQYQGEGYLPHSTFQKSGRLNEGEIRHIKSVSIVDLFPNNDGHRRKIFKTIELSE